MRALNILRSFAQTWFLLLVVIELYRLIWLLLIAIFSLQEEALLELALFMLILQRFGGILFGFILMTNSLIETQKILEAAIWVILFLKFGMWPFHQWLDLMKYTNTLILYLFITLNKFIGLLFVTNFQWFLFLICYLVWNFIFFGKKFLLQSFHLLHFWLYFRICSFVLFFCLVLVDPIFWIYYFIVYLFLNKIAWWRFHFKKNFKVTKRLLVGIFFFRLPPTFMFWAKLNLFKFLSSMRFSFLLRILLIIFRLLWIIFSLKQWWRDLLWSCDFKLNSGTYWVSEILFLNWLVLTFLI